MKKNAIWILCDQLRSDMLSCNGDPNSRTPNIDILASTGVTFTGATSGFPLCCPFRGSMLTSTYPHKCVPGHEYRLPEDKKTIADVFNENGYDTAYFGKWHLDGFKEGPNKRAAKHIVPPNRRGGFKTWIGYENNNSQWDSWVHGGEGENAFHYRLPKYETDALTDLFIDYINQKANDREKPFFAVLSVQPPHNPYVAPEQFMNNYNPANLKLRDNVPQIKGVTDNVRRNLAGAYAMLEILDYNIGRIRNVLLKTGLYFDTHIIFFSDHGDMHGSHGQYMKTTPFQEAISIPFIISGEQPYYEGRNAGRYNVLLNHVDIAPTTLGLCGISKPDWMEGVDYSHYRLSDRSAYEEPDSVFIQSVIPTGHNHSIDKPWRGLITKDGWKYVCLKNTSWLMFNLNDDPYEQMNLAHNSLYAQKRKELNDRLKKWILDTNDDFPLPEY